MSTNTKTYFNNEYFEQEGIVKKSGFESHEFHKGIIKELIDNAIDSIESVATKGTVYISMTNEGLFIGDSGASFDMELITRVLTDYDYYYSSKRNVRKVSRGSQGNALKSIQGMCYLLKYDFYVIDGDQKLQFKPQKQEGKYIVDVLPSENDMNVSKGFYISGWDHLGNDKHFFRRFLFKYQLCNNHISFIFNGEGFEASGEYKEKIEHSIHNYPYDSFQELIENMVAYDPNVTTRNFIKEFDGSRQMIASLDNEEKYLKDVDVNSLYWQMISSSEPIKDRTIKKKYLLAADDVKRIVSSYYKKEFELLSKKDIYIRETNNYYLIQGFLFYNGDQSFAMNTFASFNKSITISNDDPFVFYRDGQLYKIKNHANRVKGDFVLYLNCIAPHFEFSEYSKTQATIYHDKEIIGLYEYLFKPATKEVNKAIQEYRKEKNQSISSLMRKYFEQAFEKAKGSFSFVMARQVFYSLRELVNQNEGIDITDHYNRFTQSIITQFQKKDDRYLSIFNERRGFFYDVFFKEETPLGTKEVNRIIINKHNNKIYTYPEEKTYDFSPELLYNKVLFIEKQGFFELLKSSGILDRLNMGLICSQGFGTRAVKTLIQYFNSKDIEVYCLHDCDLSGNRIYYNLANPSYTFKHKLKVTDIGITVDDVANYNLLTEKYEADKSWKNVLNDMSKEHRDFYYLGEGKKKQYQYQRCELNSFTNDQLIDFIKDKIKPTPIVPSDDIIKNCIDLDNTDVVKEILYQKYLDSEAKIQLDSLNINNIIEKIRSNGKEHWIHSLNDNVDDEKQRIIKAACEGFKLNIQPVDAAHS